MEVILTIVLTALLSAVITALIFWLISARRMKVVQVAFAEQHERATKAEQ